MKAKETSPSNHPENEGRVLNIRPDAPKTRPDPEKIGAPELLRFAMDVAEIEKPLNQDKNRPPRVTGLGSLRVGGNGST